MQISCEKCQTAYVLDDRLIPPGGAPVQCTRCGHVFTAKSPNASRPPPPKPVAPPVANYVPAASRTTERSGTQIFGAAQAAAPSSPSSQSTQMFGTPAARTPAGSPTQIFGAVTMPAQPASSPPAGQANTTQVFGAVSAPAAAKSAGEDRPATTQIFGKVPKPAQTPGVDTPSGAASSGTQIFGAVSLPSSQPAPAAPRPAPAMTQVFGAVKVPETAPAMANKPVIAALASPQAEGDAGDDLDYPAPQAAERTLIWGKRPQAPSSGAPAAAEASTRAAPLGTPGFLAPEAGTLAEARAAEAAKAPTIQAAVPGLEMPAEHAPRSAPMELPAQSAPEGTPAPKTDPGLPAFSMPVATDAVAAPEPKPDDAPAPLSWMPPAGAEPSAAPSPKSPIPALPLPESLMQAGSQTMELQMALQQRQRRGPVIVIAVLAALAIGGGVYAFLKTRPAKIDPAVLAADEAALDLLRRDDEASIKSAIESWMAIEAKAPDYVPARANQIMAEELLVADLQDEIRRQQALYAKAEKEMKRFEEKKDYPDWLARANAKREEMIKIKSRNDPLQEEAQRRDERAGALLKSTKEQAKALKFDAAVVYRASAVYFGLKNSENAEKLVNLYRPAEDERGLLHDPKRAFADLALAALHAQLRLSQEKFAVGNNAADAALANDPKLLRVYLLKARLYLAMKDFESAKKNLTDLLVLNPQHQAAKRMMDDVQDAEQATKGGAVAEGSDK